jgi:hypothetical protein
LQRDSIEGGKREAVESAVEELRELDPYKIFTKARGRRVGMHRIYKGFLHMEGEYKSLPMFSFALEKVLGEGGFEAGKVFLKKVEEVSPEKISLIFEELLLSQGKPVVKGKKAYLYPIISKYDNFETFWVCRDEESKRVAVVGSSKEVAKAEKSGYTDFSPDCPSSSVPIAEGNKLESARLVICHYPPYPIDIDAMLFLH